MIAIAPDGLAFTMLEAALRGCLLAAFAGLGLSFFRKRSAAVESAVWGGVLAASLAMPLIMAAAPPIFFRQAAPIAEPAVTNESVFALGAAAEAPITFAPAPGPDPVDWLTLIYVAGAVAGLARLALGFAAGAALRRRSKPARIAARFEVRESDSVRVPMTFGWPRAFVVLPASWPFWEERKLEAVLLHEGAHIARGDFLLNALANFNAAIFWFSPHAWWLKQRLTDASEQASDDRALSAFNDRALYADVLLSFAGRRAGPSAALPMARGAISSRIERALDGARPLTATLGLKTGLLLGAALSAAAFFAAGVSLAEAPPKAPAAVDLRPATPPSPPAPAAAPRPAAVPSPAAAPEPWDAPTAPEPPSSPDPFDSDDTDNIDNALEGASHKANCADCAEKEAHEAWTKDYEREHSMTWTSSASDDPYSTINLRDDRVEFVNNNKRYVIDDEETCDKVREIYEPVSELGEEQAEIGEEQSRLGERMSKLGALRKESLIEASAVKARIREKMAEISAIVAKNQLTQDELGEIQGRLGDLQGDLGELQGEVAERHAEHAGDHAELAAEMSALDAQQAELGHRQAHAARKANEKVRKLIGQALADGRAREVR